MLGKFHISLSNRLLHLATTKLAIVLYFGYTVNTFWLGSGRLPVKLNYNECQEHITISFSKHEAQFSGKQPYAMFSHTPSATQRAEFSCCWRKKILKRQSTDLLLWVKKKPEFVSVFKFTDRESGKILICMKGFLEKGNSISGDSRDVMPLFWLDQGVSIPWPCTYSKSAKTTKPCWRHQGCQSEEGFQSETKPLWDYGNLF